MPVENLRPRRRSEFISRRLLLTMLIDDKRKGPLGLLIERRFILSELKLTICLTPKLTAD